MESVFLSTYKIRIKNRRLDGHAMMGLFNGKDDILPLINSFLLDIYTNPVQVGNEEEKNTFLNLTLKEPPTLLESERIIYGYFDAGISGQEINVKHRYTKKQVFNGDRDNHGLYRHIFFYIKLPFKSDSGYLILQRRSRFGIKSAFTHLLKKWIRQKGYQDTFININSVLSGSLFDRMLQNGNLKKINFIVNYIPNDVTDYYANNENPNLVGGSMTTTIQAKHGLPSGWVNFARKQYWREDRKTLVEFEGEEKEYEEIQFEIESNGRTKTFYANKKDRTVPDLDVTADVLKNVDTGEPLISSLLQKCEEIVKDTFEIKPDVQPY